MKRREVIKKIGKEAKQQDVHWDVHTEGGRHTIYLLGGKKIPIERHNEIDDGLAEKIFKECEEVLGRRWWR